MDDDHGTCSIGPGTPSASSSATPIGPEARLRRVVRICQAIAAAMRVSRISELSSIAWQLLAYLALEACCSYACAYDHCCGSPRQPCRIVSLLVHATMRMHTRTLLGLALALAHQFWVQVVVVCARIYSRAVHRAPPNCRRDSEGTCTAGHGPT